MDSHPDSLVLVKYILIVAQKDKAIEMQDKLDSFRNRFMVDLAIEMRVKQGVVFVPDTIFPTCLTCGIIADGIKSVHASIGNLQGGLSMVSV